VESPPSGGLFFFRHSNFLPVEAISSSFQALSCNLKLQGQHRETGCRVYHEDVAKSELAIRIAHQAM
jgi:hypothetical protein